MFFATVLLRRFFNPSGFGSSESIDVLPRVANSNEPSAHQLLKKGVIDWRQVLVFVNENKWKLRVCSTEQCGHVNLIVVVHEPFVGLLDATLKDGIDEVGGKVIRDLV